MRTTLSESYLLITPLLGKKGLDLTRSKYISNYIWFDMPVYDFVILQIWLYMFIYNHILSPYMRLHMNIYGQICRMTKSYTSIS